jgi:hypothetical protein
MKTITPNFDSPFANDWSWQEAEANYRDGVVPEMVTPSATATEHDVRVHRYTTLLWSRDKQYLAAIANREAGLISAK